MTTTDSTVTLSLTPLDPHCRLLSNFLWARDRHGHPTLSQQHLWVRFARPIMVLGCRFTATANLGPMRFETSPDDGQTWQVIAVVTTCPMAVNAHLTEGVDSTTQMSALPLESVGHGAFQCRWPSQTVDNIRVVVAKAPNPTFPLTDYMTRLELVCAGDGLPFDAPPSPVYQPLTETHLCPWQPVAGSSGLNINDRLGHCHLPPENDRVVVTSHGDEIEMASPLLRLSFSPHLALLRHLGWDLTGHGREQLNLLSTGNTQGAFPVVLRGCERRAGDVGGGRLELNGRSLTYRDVRVVPEFDQALTFTLREDGLRLELGWKCAQNFRTAEFAALRLPLDLYQTVMSVLALPNTAGPSGLVDLPLVLHAPNHGSLQLTVVENASDHPVLARVSPLRVQAELWLDLIVGAQPLANGLFEIPAGSGRVVLDLQLNKIYPFAGTDIYTTWQRPPFYSFVDRERILGALPNAWLSGLSFRPELAMFANNSVAEAAAPCAPFYADIAAFTPDLAPGLPATAILRCVADSQLLSEGKSAYSDYDHFPTAASAPLDLAWLTVASTGDWAWAECRCAEITHWAEILLSMEYQQTGLVASKYSGRAADPQDFMSCSWWDSIRSGHLESHVDAYCYRTALRSSELLARLGQTTMAARLRAMAARAREHFMPTFFDPHTRRMAQWADVDGVRYGFDSHPHLSAGIMCGLVPQDLARELLMEYLQRLRSRGFTAYQYGLPILLDPIPPYLHNNWMGKGVELDGSDAVGAYMNGSITHHHAYEILQALYQVGLRREANDLFVKLTPLARSGGLSAGLHSGVDWRNPDGAPAGYEGLLAEQYQFLLAAVTGYMGWELTLDGLRLNPAVRAACSERVQQARPNFARMAP